MPAPTCSSENFKFDSLDDVETSTKYLGDASKANWVTQGKPIKHDGGLLMTMAPDTVGTLLSSAHYVWYGKISAKMKSSKGQGVVTAFILMSDVKDEVDFEFIGTDTQVVQSNYYWQGNLDYTKNKNLTASDTDTETHEYTIDWTPDEVKWSVDGEEMRKVERSKTWNDKLKIYEFPQTPARVQLSLWPAGLPSNGKGTVEWAGGEIDWNSSDMSNGYYSAWVGEIDIECYDPPDDATQKGKSSYVYADNKGTQKSIEITDDETELASMYATGENPDADPEKSKKKEGSKTDSADDSVNTEAATVPGESGGGARGSEGEDGPSGSASSSDGGADSDNSVGGGTDGGFSQGNNLGNSGSGGGDSTEFTGGSSKLAELAGTRAMQGSGFAVLVAVVALVAF
ncbi:MAG: hypothetical protein M1831_006495 [Alyxoria varia]|nr:MAG: hypothetical protein M1831_006495 [Alyxoria varia]